MQHVSAAEEAALGLARAACCVPPPASHSTYPFRHRVSRLTSRILQAGIALRETIGNDVSAALAYKPRVSMLISFISEVNRSLTECSEDLFRIWSARLVEILELLKLEYLRFEPGWEAEDEEDDEADQKEWDRWGRVD